MCWVYDKRPKNGSQFVYFGMLPIDPKSEEAKILIPYARGVLDALGMAHGVSRWLISSPVYMFIPCNGS